MNRAIIFKKIKERLLSSIRNLEGSILSYKTASDIDENDTIEPEDFSHQSEAKDMQLRLEELLKQEKQKLKWMEKHEEESHNIIENGAIIETDDFVILLGVSVPVFSFNEKQLFSISSSAPLYKSLINLKGATFFKMGATEQRVEKIY